MTSATARQSPRVFIGLPVFNGARFLVNALDSLLAQTYRDFTLLVADNASTDATPEICRHYVATDSRVGYVRHPRNLGAPFNWNFVALQATGDYFKWSTANDECAPDMLERCVAALQADPSAVLCQGRTCLVDEETGARQVYDNDIALLESSPSDRVRRLWQQLALNNGQTGLIRREMLMKTRLEREYRGGDYALMAELALLGRFIVLPQVLQYRRMGATTFSRYIHGNQLGGYYGPFVASGAFTERLRLHADMIHATMTSPIPWRERSVAVLGALRRVVWDRGKFWRDLRSSAGI